MHSHLIWINGPFGVGKTTLARQISAVIGQSIVVDPERLGHLLWDQIPHVFHAEEFECEPVWRDTLLCMLRSIAQTYSWPIIVPMTIARPLVYDEVVGGLRGAGIRVAHFTLLADPDAIAARLNKRGDGPASWEAKQIERCVQELSHKRYAEHIDTTAMFARDVVRRVVDRLGMPVPTRDRS